MKKYLLTTVLILALVMTLTACGKHELMCMISLGY